MPWFPNAHALSLAYSCWGFGAEFWELGVGGWGLSIQTTGCEPFEIGLGAEPLAFGG